MNTEQFPKSKKVLSKEDGTDMKKETSEDSITEDIRGIFREASNKIDRSTKSPNLDKQDQNYR